MASRFEPNPNLEGLLARSTETKTLLGVYTEEIARVARDLVPKATRALHDSIEGDVGLDEHGFLGRVNAHDYKAHWVEFGTVREDARPFLRPAAEQILGPLRDAP